jgi:hypothetical protein
MPERKVVVSCCNNDCEQGKDCPARVARVGGYRKQTRQPLPPTTWRNNVRHLAWWMLVTFIVMLLAALTVGVFA